MQHRVHDVFVALSASVYNATHKRVPGRPGVCGGVDEVDPIATKAGQHEEVPGAAGVAMAARAGVPAAVVDLVTQVRHVQPVDHLIERKRGLCESTTG